MKIAVTKLITSVGATAWVVAEGMGKGGQEDEHRPWSILVMKPFAVIPQDNLKLLLLLLALATNIFQFQFGAQK